MLLKHGTTNLRAWRWMVLAFVGTALTAGLTATILGLGKTGATAAIKVSALSSFSLFLPAYAGRPLTRLFGNRFDIVLQRGRELGLAFAAALAVHLGLVAFTIARSAHPFVPNRLEVAEIVGAFWIYALAVFSIARLRVILSPPLWRWMLILGMDYIALIFALNFISFPLKAFYLPFLFLAVGAIILRIASAFRSHSSKVDDSSDGCKLRISCTAEQLETGGRHTRGVVDTAL